MALNIEDYAMIGDCHTAALVGRGRHAADAIAEAISSN